MCYLGSGLFLYMVFASLDVHLTMKGINGDVNLEGNPVIRHMLASFGILSGLIIEKALVLMASLTISIVAFTGLEKKADWVYYLAFTHVTRNWMKRKKRYWVAFLPIYFVALSQGLAAMSWIVLMK